ncbi:MAG: HDOD domain-containing protein [Phycisphaerae bacterium]|nr:HDOD domain-containing protein [Phycisphaerae bacterium]
MKARAELSAADVVQMLAALDRRLESIGLRTQPGVAVRVLELSAQSDAALTDYARVIRTDAGIVGRILKLANSAAFAQRQPVTSLDRACVLLGLERIKSIAIGFYLCRSAADPEGGDLSGRVWGQSVLRACLAAEAARLTLAELTSEAFVVGLMQDAGIQLMPALVGRGVYAGLLRDAPGPQVLFERETLALPFTHVDVMSALAARWRLPEVLTKPMVRHHTAPKSGKIAGSIGRLHRIAHFVGGLDLSGGAESPAIPGLGRELGLQAEQAAELMRLATQEYRLTCSVFPGATPISDLEALAERVQTRLIAALDRGVEDLSLRSGNGPLDLVVSGQRIQIHADADALGQAVLYILGDGGERVMSHCFPVKQASAAALLRAVAVEPPADRSVLDQITTYLNRLAA